MFPMTTSQSWLFIILTLLLWVFGALAINEQRHHNHLKSRVKFLDNRLERYAHLLSWQDKTIDELMDENAELERKLGDYARNRAFEIAVDFAKDLKN